MAVNPEDYRAEEDQEVFLGENSEDDDFAEGSLDTEPETKADAGLWSAETNRTPADPGFSEEALRAALPTARKGDARTYAMEESFSPSELILHEQFGLGIVVKALTSRKMLVVFQEESKILVMSYPPRA
jgi:hypothetical protein